MYKLIAAAVVAAAVVAGVAAPGSEPATVKPKSCCTYCDECKCAAGRCPLQCTVSTAPRK